MAERTPGDEIRHLAQWLPRYGVAGLIVETAAITVLISKHEYAALPALVTGIFWLLVGTIMAVMFKPLIILRAEKLDRMIEESDGA